MEILRQRKSWVETRHFLHFDYADMPGAGFSFVCDQSGAVDPAKLPQAAQASYQACLRGEVNGRKMSASYMTNAAWPLVVEAEGRCACGRVVVLNCFTNTCEHCGRDYNRGGQELAPRSQWGMDTGESLSEILSIP